MLQDDILALIGALQSNLAVVMAKQEQINATLQQVIKNQGEIDNEPPGLMDVMTALGQINVTLQEAIDNQGQVNSQQEMSNVQQAAAISALQMKLPGKSAPAVAIIFLKYTVRSCRVRAADILYNHSSKQRYNDNVVKRRGFRF